MPPIRNSPLGMNTCGIPSIGDIRRLEDSAVTVAMGVLVGMIATAVAEGFATVGTIVGTAVNVGSAAIGTSCPEQAERKKRMMIVGMSVFIFCFAQAAVPGGDYIRGAQSGPRTALIARKLWRCPYKG